MFGLRQGLKKTVRGLVNRVQGAGSSAAEAPPAPRPVPAPIPFPSPPAPAAAPPRPSGGIAAALSGGLPSAESEPEAVSAASPAAEADNREEEAPAPEPTPAPAPAPAPIARGIAARVATASQEEEIDLSVSYTSGPAAEAAARAMATRDMINFAADGTPYWGSLDNESSRAKAAGLLLIIDQWECIQCGTCVENTDQVFTLPDDAKAVVIRQEGPMELIQDAIDACPVTCIHWTDAPQKFAQINDSEGRALD